jgi:methyltransferase (TIGR00027 family)
MAELMEDKRPMLRGVSETLLIPLAARALMARRDPVNFVDPLSTHFLEMLGEDASRFETDRWNMAGASARTTILDREVRRSLQEHQQRGQSQTVVVNLGAGLCSRYWRLGSPPGVRWVDVDLPDVIELKRQLVAKCQSELGLDTGEWSSIPTDVTQDAWLTEIGRNPNEGAVIIAEGLLMYLPEEEVKRLLDRLVATYPGGRMYLETWSPFVRRVWGYLSSRIRKTGTSVRWGLRRPTALTEWNRKIQVQNSWSPGDINPEQWGLLRFAPRIRRSLMKIIELQFGN